MKDIVQDVINNKIRAILVLNFEMNKNIMKSIDRSKMHEKKLTGKENKYTLVSIKRFITK